jgi:hypothetical protein
MQVGPFFYDDLDDLKIPQPKGTQLIFCFSFQLHISYVFRVPAAAIPAFNDTLNLSNKTLKIYSAAHLFNAPVPMHSSFTQYPVHALLLLRCIYCSNL